MVKMVRTTRTNIDVVNSVIIQSSNATEANAPVISEATNGYIWGYANLKRSAEQNASVIATVTAKTTVTITTTDAAANVSAFSALVNGELRE